MLQAGKMGLMGVRIWGARLWVLEDQVERLQNCSFCGGFLVCRGQYPSKVVQGRTTGELLRGWRVDWRTWGAVWETGQKDLLENQHDADIWSHAFQDFRDLLLTSWCQIPQHTFVFWAGFRQVVMMFCITPNCINSSTKTLAGFKHCLYRLKIIVFHLSGYIYLE